jgi:hypothetical protein
MRCVPVSDEKSMNYIWLDKPTLDRFVKYRQGIGLAQNTTLVRLLIRRELKLCRLSQPWSGPVPRGSEKIPIQLSSDELELQNHLPQEDLSEALRRLVCIELEENWLRRALEWVPDQ